MKAVHKPPLEEVYLSHISLRPWSTYTKADYTPEQWHKACLIHQHEGSPKTKEQCKLPVRTPNGALNKNGVHAAMAALNGARGGVIASTSEKMTARAALRRLYSELGEEAPGFATKHDGTMDEDEALLIHFGIKGMRWGVRRDDLPGVSRAINKEASKDASEFARAKMFHGEGAGVRRRLIKATVNSKSKNPDYKKAFDHHLDRQDLGTHASKAKGERKRKDVKKSVGKTARGINRTINGPFAAPIAATAVLAAYGAARASGYDKTIMSAGRGAVNRMRYGANVDLGFLRN